MRYDYLIVGAGLYGSIFAREALKAGKKVLVIDKRNHVAGNIYTENIEGINVHKFGAHIFHTDSKEIWEYIRQFSEFNNYINSPIAIYKNGLYNLPFNMNTFSKMWNINTPFEAKSIINKQKMEISSEPKNLEEKAISLVGRDIYEKLIKGYTEKQWGKSAIDLPPFIIQRIPVRFVYDNNYFNDRYQGIPVDGYTAIIDRMLQGVEVKLDTDFFSNRPYFENIAEKVLFTGMIDEYYDYCYGELEYRSLRFETDIFNTGNFQGNAVVNYTEFEVPYTRIIEHKHFEFQVQNGVNDSKTVITKEYPALWKKGKEPYYAINNTRNNQLYEKYKELSERESKILFGGRLGMYKYYDMDDTIESALELSKIELSNKIHKK